MSQIRGAVLEGCSAAGKTSVLKALKTLQAQRDLERSVVILGEHYSQALQKIDGEYRRLDELEHRQLLIHRLEALEELRRWSERLGPGSLQSRGVFFALERFHLNHRVAYDDRDTSWSEKIEQRLRQLNATCFVLTISEAAIGDRLAYRLRSRGEAPDAESLDRACTDFRAEQRRLLGAARASTLPTVVIESDDLDWARHANDILDGLGSAGR